MDISTDYEWDALFINNELGKTSSNTRKVLDQLKAIRRNVLFNRFFAVHEGFNTKKFIKFYPFTEEQKSILIGFDVPYHYKLINKELKDLESRTERLKKIIMVGQKGLNQFE